MSDKPVMAGRIRFYVALDNHEPVRRDAVREAEVWQWPGREDVRQIRIQGAADVFPDAYRAIYLLDDGESVTPYYVSGYNPTNFPGAVFLTPFPVNPGGRKMRADRSEPVDYSTWHMGPRKAYHLKIRKG